MQLKKLIILFALVIIFSGIAAIFWYQETRYRLPTSVPENYQHIAIGSRIAIASITRLENGKPFVLHFFNPDCPCSRFNIDHLRRLVNAYRHQINLYAVLQVEDEHNAADGFQEKYALNIPVIIDTHKKLAVACGIYSTPQAAIINQNGVLYYRGNYNKSRYCTTQDSNFAQMALDSLLAGTPPPVFTELATIAYGCELPGGSLETNLKNFDY